MAESVEYIVIQNLKIHGKDNCMQNAIFVFKLFALGGVNSVFISVAKCQRPIITHTNIIKGKN